ncbi:hypothetical protein ACKWTF_013835 [Chironomus riparius]
MKKKNSQNEKMLNRMIYGEQMGVRQQRGGRETENIRKLSSFLIASFFFTHPIFLRARGIEWFIEFLILRKCLFCKLRTRRNDFMCKYIFVRFCEDVAPIGEHPSI